MNKIILLISALFSFVLNAEVLPDAKELVSKAWHNYRQHSDTEQENIRILLEKNGQRSEKNVTRWTRFLTDGEKVLIRFEAPAADKGLALLIHNEGSQKQMWLKMPSWGKERRIAAHREAQYFAGTDLTFEDNKLLVGEQTADFNYQIVSTNPEGWQIEAVAAAHVVSAYGKRRIWLTKDLAISKIEFYDPEHQLIKTLTNLFLQVDAEGRWRANSIEVVNHQDQSRSVFEIRQRQFPSDWSEHLFNPARLAD